MKFNSTRGKVIGRSFEEALFSPGYQLDGGLLLPESYPPISRETLQAWAKLTFTDLFKEVFSLFVDEEEIARTDLHVLIDRAFAKADYPEVVLLKPLKGGVHLVELFHSRTLAFKDISVGVMGEVMNYFMNKRGKHVTLLVSTSGDTGSSCIEAVRGLDGIDIVVMYPTKGRITDIQERSMTTVLDKNVHVFGVDAGSDDMDTVIKSVSLDETFVARHSIGTANSINIARVMGQSVIFFYTYLQLCPSCDEEVEIIVPSGSGGNMTGGVIAHAMGLPVKIVAAVNQNDVLHRAFTSGDFSKKDVAVTLSPAIDIQSPYNMERMVHILSGQDCSLVNQILTQFESTGAVTFPEDLMKKLSSTLSSYGCNDEIVKSTMRRCWEENDGHVLCPHTAVGMSCFYHRKPSGKQHPVAVYATASPAKFPEAVRAAGLTPVTNSTIEKWLKLPPQETQLSADQDWTGILRERIESITKRVEGNRG